MELPFPPTVLFLLLLSSATATATTSAAVSSLDPKQLTALRSLGLPTTNDPCSLPTNATLCDASQPFRHLLSLTLSNCSDSNSLSTTALLSLSSLLSLHFLHCPLPLVHFPSALSLHLVSFSSISSLPSLSGVFLSRFKNLSDLTVSSANISASGPSVFLSSLRKLQSLTISNTSLSGRLPKSWHHNLTHIDLSINQLKGKIHPSITSLDNLISLNLSFNQLAGPIPDSIGDLIELRNLSLSSNSLSGPIPETLAAIPSLSHLDLSYNRLNGSIPRFLSEMKELKYLNLENNDFHGVIPFNTSFIERLKVFKVSENTNLCYNRSTVLPRLKLGIAPCDKFGLPMSPPAKAVDSGGGGGYEESDYGGDEDSQKDHGPNKVVLGVAIGLASIIFLVIFLFLLSKWCA